MIDYVARAREASRRWREEHGLPPRDELPSFRSFSSSPQKSEEATKGGRFGDIEGTTETTETTHGGEKRPLYSPSSRYAFPWPDQVEGLGPRHIEAFTPCANCETGTWVVYGRWPLCLRCADLSRAR